MTNTDVSAIEGRLADAAATGETVELILVLRGKVRPAHGKNRWRIRAEGRHVVTFRAESVVATRSPAASNGDVERPPRR